MTTSFPQRPRVLVLAHSCNPEYGSEPGQGWNCALQIAKHFDTWILCDEAYNRAAIERYIGQHGEIANLNFAFVPPGSAEARLARIPGTFWVRYNLWHRRAFQIAKRLHQRERFNLVHQLNLNGFREPGYLWQLNAPLIWGPVGGAQNYPWRFLPSASFAGAAGELVRNVLNTWQSRASRRVGRAARKADVMLAATGINARAMARRRHGPVRVLLETGVHVNAAPPNRVFQADRPLHLLWSGVFEHRKALHLLLHALAALPPQAKYELQILGRGPLEKRWRKLARRLGVDQHCQWLGWLDHEEAIARFRWADMFVFSSLRDTSGNVMLESLAAGTPILCFDHQGAGEIVTPECGIKLPVTKPAEAIRLLSDALLRCHDDRQQLNELSHGAFHRAQYYGWNQQGARMVSVYRDVLGIPETPSAASAHDESVHDDSENTLFQASAVQSGPDIEPIAAGNERGVL